PLLAFFDAGGHPDLNAAAARPLPERERAITALSAAVRRVLLGYDQRRDIDAQLRAVLEAPLPVALAPSFLTELAAVRSAIAVFADTEILFSRQPEAAPAGGTAPSNDGWLGVYLRTVRRRGAGLPHHFLTPLRRAPP